MWRAEHLHCVSMTLLFCINYQNYDKKDWWENTFNFGQERPSYRQTPSVFYLKYTFYIPTK